MPRGLARKLMLSITVIVVIVAAVSGLVNIHNEEVQLLYTMTLGADQLSKAITSATWNAMLDDRREEAYSVMQTIAQKQGIDRIRIFNRTGEVRFSTNSADLGLRVDRTSPTCAICHAQGGPLLNVPLPSRRLVHTGPDNRRRLEMVTPIYNERSCSEAACHAHPAEMKILGVVDLSLNLDSVDREVAGMKARVLLVTGVEITLIGLFIIFFTRRFVTRPITKLIGGFKAVSQMELDKPLEIDDGSEELDELARSFNVMRDRLRAALAEINQFTQNLETKVEERTQQLKAAQKKLLQSDRLASLGQLSASVAHEINNPISGVLNLSMLMQRMLKDDGVPAGRLDEFRKYLAQVTSETGRVGRIVSDLLAFSRRGKPNRAPADLNKIVRMTLSLVQHKMKLSNVTVETHLAQDLPQAHCDASQIQQVALNLALNAAEATQGKPERRVDISTAMSGDAVLLVVSDNGEGIPPENLNKIFDPFFTTKPEGKGVGLGLAVSYGIVQAHGGDIEVKSILGEGTTFTVSLPVGQPAPPGGAVPLETVRDA
ncbi:MAG TPA: ATP-binding protein [Bryobacteraceae bacterium]|nr:ATP-binding protein [Bryobacteraceae bacterium]